MGYFKLRPLEFFGMFFIGRSLVKEEVGNGKGHEANGEGTLGGEKARLVEINIVHGEDKMEDQNLRRKEGSTHW